MRVATYFNSLLYFDRYYPQFKALGEFVDMHIIYLEGTPEPEWEGVTFHKLRASSNVLSFLLNYGAVTDLCRELDPDICYALSDGRQMDYMRHVSWVLELPYVVRVRGDYREIEKYRRRGLAKTYIDFLRERCYRHASALVDTVSAPSGVDFKTFKPDHMVTDCLTVGYAGRFSPEKGIDKLIETANLMPEARFKAVGRLDKKETFPSNVEYMGYWGYNDMPGFYNSIDVLLLPSYTEGFPLVILEAYACNIPVVCAKDVYPMELPIFGMLTETHEPEEYARALNFVYDRLPFIQWNIRSEIKDYTWKNFAEKVVGVFDSVV